jgi:hypothetical protein
MEKIAQLVKMHNATSNKTIDDVAAAAVAPVIAAARKMVKGKELALIFINCGAAVASAATIVSDMRALGEYMASYPEAEGQLATPGGKHWRNLLCAARRGHRLKGGGAKGEAVTQVLAKHGGIKARQVSTALTVLADHQEEVNSILAMLTDRAAPTETAVVPELAKKGVDRKKSK